MCAESRRQRRKRTGGLKIEIGRVCDHYRKVKGGNRTPRWTLFKWVRKRIGKVRERSVSKNQSKEKGKREKKGIDV